MRNHLSHFALLLLVFSCSSGEPAPASDAGKSATAGAGNSPIGGVYSATASGTLCEVCSETSDCREGLCLVNDRTSERFCGRDCTSDSDCTTSDFECARVNGSSAGQCVPVSGSCDESASAPAPAAGAGGSAGSGGAASAPAGGTASAVPGQTAGACDPAFLGPFCENDEIVGFDRGPEVDNPSPAEVQAFSVQALNYIRSLTCLPPLSLDSCLSGIGEAALAANATLGIHGHFKKNCMNAAHDFGDSCECDWSQENYGAASGSSRTWKDGVIVPLCAMMEEPKGVGHRSNIEHDAWTRVGIGVEYGDNGASWYHEFGR